VISEHVRLLLYEFSLGFTAEGATTRIVEPLNLVIIHIMQHHLIHLSDILRPFVICIIVKVFNGFLMIQKRMTLKVQYIMLESFIGHACQTVS